VRLAIEDVLDAGLPRAYSPDPYNQKCALVFEHIYETYGDRGQTTWAAPSAHYAVAATGRAKTEYGASSAAVANCRR
jgi:hypothetical protein